MAARRASRVVIAIGFAGAAACSLDWSVPPSRSAPSVGDAAAVTVDAASDSRDDGELDVHVPSAPDVSPPDPGFCHKHADCVATDEFYCAKDSCATTSPGVPQAGTCTPYNSQDPYCIRGQVCGCNGQAWEFCTAVRNGFEFTASNTNCPTLDSYIKCDDVYCLDPGQFCLKQSGKLSRCVQANGCPAGVCSCYQSALDADPHKESSCTLTCKPGSTTATCN